MILGVPGGAFPVFTCELLQGGGGQKCQDRPAQVVLLLPALELPGLAVMLQEHVDVIAQDDQVLAGTHQPLLLGPIFGQVQLP